MPLHSTYSSIYTAPRLPHEWWRDTLPTVPRSREWEEVIALVERLEDGMSLAVLRGRPRTDLTIPSPGTEVFGIQVVCAGALSIALDDGPVCRPQAGGLVVFHHLAGVGCRTRLTGGEDVHVVDIRFSPQALARATPCSVLRLIQRQSNGDSLPLRGGSLLTYAAGPAVQALAVSMLACPFPDGPARHLWLRARAQEVLAHVLDQLSGPDGATVPAERFTARENSALDRVLARLQTTYEQDWSVAALARFAGLPEKKLQAGLRVRTGLPVHALLRHIRLCEAARQLAQGVTVTEAAIAVGYTNMSHFSKVFRQQFGVAPLRFRGVSDVTASALPHSIVGIDGARAAHAADKG